MQCVLCGALYSLDEVKYVCPACGPVGTLDVVLNPSVLWPTRVDPVRRSLVWEEERFLPIAHDLPTPNETIPLKVGNTPYYPLSTAENRYLRPRRFAIKDDGKNPTASFKDRASAMVVHHALTIGVSVVATASTGNAAAALAGISAAIPQIQAVIFVPAAAPQAKIAQLLVYGAKVILVDGTYDEAFDSCWTACEEFGWYNRSTGINPFTSEGKKTIAWEIAFSGYEMPDVMCIPVGDGSIIGSTYKGFADLKKLGWIDRIPRLIGVQSAGSSALVHAWENQLDPREIQPQPAQTVADSISASLPRDRAKALRAVRETDGALIRVTDSDILQAIPVLAQTTGVFAEPAAAAAYAGWLAALEKGYVHTNERVLILNTGSGLKDINSAMKSVQGELHPVKPHMDEIRKAVARFEW
ncbi:MAG: threonine synthase [Anaerolineae bacterium]|nr:threonine synthase [Anaerolineae bacterium]